MRSDHMDIKVSQLPLHLDDQQWRLVQRSVWRGPPLDDAALAAAASLLARRERIGAWLALAAFGVLSAGAGLGLANGAGVASVGLFVLSLVGLIGSAVALWLLRRSERLHARSADYRRLEALTKR